MSGGSGPKSCLLYSCVKNPGSCCITLLWRDCQAHNKAVRCFIVSFPAGGTRGPKGQRWVLNSLGSPTFMAVVLWNRSGHLTQVGPFGDTSAGIWNCNHERLAVLGNWTHTMCDWELWLAIDCHVDWVTKEAILQGERNRKVMYREVEMRDEETLPI